MPPMRMPPGASGMCTRWSRLTLMAASARKVHRSLAGVVEVGDAGAAVGDLALGASGRSMRHREHRAGGHGGSGGGDGGNGGAGGGDGGRSGGDGGDGGEAQRLWCRRRTNHKAALGISSWTHRSPRPPPSTQLACSRQYHLPPMINSVAARLRVTVVALTVMANSALTAPPVLAVVEVGDAGAAVGDLAFAPREKSVSVKKAGGGTCAATSERSARPTRILGSHACGLLSVSPLRYYINGSVPFSKNSHVDA